MVAVIVAVIVICFVAICWSYAKSANEKARLKRLKEQAEFQRQEEEKERERKQQEADAARVRAEEEAQRKAKQKAREEQMLAERAAIIETVRDPQILEYVNAPEGDFIGADGLPSNSNSKQKWGDKYTFYITSTGKAYHKKDCRYAGYLPINAYEIEAGATASAYSRGKVYYKCGICNPELPDMLWVKRVHEINNDLRKYNIDHDAVSLPAHLFPRR